MANILDEHFALFSLSRIDPSCLRCRLKEGADVDTLRSGMSLIPGQYPFIVVVEAASADREMIHPKGSLYEFPQSRSPV